MKNKLFLTLILTALFSLVIQAHDDEDINDTKLISNHPLTGTWTAKSRLNDSSLKFHMGHGSPAKSPVILRLDLCGNGDTLVGTVEQIKLIDAPRKLNIESASITDVIEVPEEGYGGTEYTILLNSLTNGNVAVTMIASTSDIFGQISINFANQEEVNYYTGKLKQNKASAACKKLLNATENDSDE